jgi:hypothetical protein
MVDVVAIGDGHRTSWVGTGTALSHDEFVDLWYSDPVFAAKQLVTVSFVRRLG